MTATTKPTTLRRHIWSLRELAALCERHGLSEPKVEIAYDGEEMEAQWFMGYSASPPGPDGFRKVMAALPDLTWERNAASDVPDGTYNSNYFRVTSVWEIEGGQPVKLEIWTTRNGFPTEQFADLPVKAKD